MNFEAGYNQVMKTAHLKKRAATRAQRLFEMGDSSPLSLDARRLLQTEGFAHSPLDLRDLDELLRLRSRNQQVGEAADQGALRELAAGKFEGRHHYYPGAGTLMRSGPVWTSGPIHKLP
jgi:hypothetical protein